MNILTMYREIAFLAGQLNFRDYTKRQFRPTVRSLEIVLRKIRSRKRQTFRFDPLYLDTE